MADGRLQASWTGDEAEKQKIVILFLAADPTDATRLRLGQESREIREQLSSSQLRNRFEFHERFSVRARDVSRALLELKPNIVHFSGHGTAEGEICFENDDGTLQPARAEALSELFEQCAENVTAAILNACYSGRQAQAIAEKIAYVVGISRAISDNAAIAFSVGFYQALGAGKEVEPAYKLGKAQIGLRGIDESHALNLLIGNISPKTERTPEQKRNIKDLEYFVNQVDVIKFITSEHSSPYHLIDAPAGFGKSILIQALKTRMEEAGWRCSYARVRHPKTSAEVIAQIARGLGVPAHEGASGASLAKSLARQYEQTDSPKVAIFIDVEKPLPDDLKIVEELLDGFIPDMADGLEEANFSRGRHNPFRVVIASRYLTGKLRERPKIPLTPHKLKPFTYQTILEAASKRVSLLSASMQEQFAAHLMHYTAGHPGCISATISLYEEHGRPEPSEFFREFENQIWNDIVFPEISDVRESIDKEVRRVFENLSVFRLLDPGILREALKHPPYAPEFADEFDLQDKLRRTYLMDADGMYLRDSIARKLLSIWLLNDVGPRQFAFQCAQAREICRQRLQAPVTQQPDRWLLEYLYQSLQGRIAEIQEPGSRNAIRENFFQEDLPQGFNLFASARDPREYRISIEKTLNEDWEMQFTVNYFLRENRFDDSENSPWMNAKRQILRLFNS